MDFTYPWNEKFHGLNIQAADVVKFEIKHEAMSVATLQMTLRVLDPDLLPALFDVSPTKIIKLPGIPQWLTVEGFRSSTTTYEGREILYELEMIISGYYKTQEDAAAAVMKKKLKE